MLSTNILIFSHVSCRAQHFVQIFTAPGGFYINISFVNINVIVSIVTNLFHEIYQQLLDEWLSECIILKIPWLFICCHHQITFSFRSDVCFTTKCLQDQHTLTLCLLLSSECLNTKLWFSSLMWWRVLMKESNWITAKACWSTWWLIVHSFRSPGERRRD